MGILTVQTQAFKMFGLKGQVANTYDGLTGGDERGSGLVGVLNSI